MDIYNLYELRWFLINESSSTYDLVADIDASPTNPDNVSYWETETTYHEGDWVAYEPLMSIEYVWYCNVVSTTEEPGVGSDWVQMWPSDGWEPIGIDNVVFDGHHHKITDLYCGSDLGASLFGTVTNSTVRNVHLVNTVVMFGEGTGALAQDVRNSTITACSLYNGYIVGPTYDGNRTGGLIGRIGFRTSSIAGNVTISECAVIDTYFNVYMQEGMDLYGFGLLIGWVDPHPDDNIVIRDCCAIGTMEFGKGEVGPDISRTGGLIGNEDQIEAVDYGVTEITNCYTAVDFIHDSAEFPGLIYWSTMTDFDHERFDTTAVFADAQIQQSAPSDHAGFGRLTSQMTDIETYTTGGAAWDMVDTSVHDGQRSTAIWHIDGGREYPQLWYTLDSTPVRPRPHHYYGARPVWM